jgi:hypothetical protein
MKKNLFIEYRKWVFFWGLLLDGQEEVQKVLDKHNVQGWHCVQFEWDGSRKFKILKLIIVLLTTIITLGFVSYWTGFSIVFEKDDTVHNQENMNNTQNNNSAFENWKKENPTKSLNDFYRDNV